VSKTQKLLKTFSSCPDIKILVFMYSGPLSFFSSQLLSIHLIPQISAVQSCSCKPGYIARCMHELVARISFSTGTIKQRPKSSIDLRAVFS
jgi:hypothetical protein